MTCSSVIQLTRLAFLFIFATALCSCISTKDARITPGDHNYSTANPAANRYFLLFGSVDPAMKIRMAARWVAKNPDCSVNINWLEGVRIADYTDIPLKLTWNGTRYSTLVYFDALAPGRCNWSFKSVVVSGVDNQGRIMEMADWSRPAPDEKAYSDLDVWGDLVLVTKEPLLGKDVTGTRGLICTPSYDNPHRPHVLQCGAILVHPGWAAGSSLWITPQTRQAQVNFRY